VYKEEDQIQNTSYDTERTPLYTIINHSLLITTALIPCGSWASWMCSFSV